MALGALVSVNAAAAHGPLFCDTVTLVGDSAYASGGTTGLAAKLRTLRGDARAIVFVNVEDGAGYLVSYIAATDKLLFFLQDAGGALAEATGDLSAVTVKLVIVSK